MQCQSGLENNQPANDSVKFHGFPFRISSPLRSFFHIFLPVLVTNSNPAPVSFVGVRRRDCRVGHVERGLLQGLNADHAAPARQLDVVDLRHARGRGRAPGGWR